MVTKKICIFHLHVAGYIAKLNPKKKKKKRYKQQNLRNIEIWCGRQWPILWAIFCHFLKPENNDFNTYKGYFVQ
jgi:hypothetical protein